MLSRPNQRVPTQKTKQAPLCSSRPCENAFHITATLRFFIKPRIRRLSGCLWGGAKKILTMDEQRGSNKLRERSERLTSVACCRMSRTTVPFALPYRHIMQEEVAQLRETVDTDREALEFLTADEVAENNNKGSASTHLLAHFRPSFCGPNNFPLFLVSASTQLVIACDRVERIQAQMSPLLPLAPQGERHFHVPKQSCIQSQKV